LGIKAFRKTITIATHTSADTTVAYKTIAITSFTGIEEGAS
jgi:hypothetical protein